MQAPLCATPSLHRVAVVLRFLRAAENPLGAALPTMLIPERAAALRMGLFGWCGASDISADRGSGLPNSEHGAPLLFLIGHIFDGGIGQ